MLEGSFDRPRIARVRKMFFGANSCKFYVGCFVYCRLVSGLAVGLGREMEWEDFFMLRNQKEGCSLRRLGGGGVFAIST